MIDVTLKGKTPEKVDTHTPKNTMGKKGETGLVTYTDDLKPPKTFFGSFLINPSFGADLNINVGFTGTPEKVHDGTDLSLWAASALSGIWDFASTTHAKQGIITVIQFGNLSGAVINVAGTNITTTTLTEGVDWTAGVDNDTTAGTIQSAVDGIAGVSATVSGSVVEVTADNATTEADITTLTTDADAGDMTTTAQSIDGSLTANGEESLLEDGTSTNMANFSSMTLSILITAWDITKGNDVEIRARNNGVDVGNVINISDFIDPTNLGVWQSVALAKSEFGLDQDTIDEFVIMTVSTASGVPNAPSYYIDIFQIEETGAPVSFSFSPPVGTTFFGATSTIEVISPSSDTEPFVSWNKYGEASKLPIGFQTRLTVGGQSFLSTGLRSNADVLSLPAMKLNVFVDGTNKIFQFQQDTGGIILNGDTEDKFEVIVNDDFSSFVFYRYFLAGLLQAN